MVDIIFHSIALYFLFIYSIKNLLMSQKNVFVLNEIQTNYCNN